jgi:hypothetical protein
MPSPEYADRAVEASKELGKDWLTILRDSAVRSSAEEPFGTFVVIIVASVVVVAIVGNVVIRLGTVDRAKVQKAKFDASRENSRKSSSERTDRRKTPRNPKATGTGSGRKRQAMWLTIGGVVILGCFAAVSMRSLFEAIRERRALAGAWTYRQNIANVAGQLEGDFNAPADVQMIAKYVADHAFNKRELRRVFAALEKANRIPASPKEHDQSMRDRFGDRYGPRLEALVRDFTAVVLIENGVSRGFRATLRQSHRGGQSPSKEEFTEKAPAVWEAVSPHAYCPV